MSERPPRERVAALKRALAGLRDALEAYLGIVRRAARSLADTVRRLREHPPRATTCTPADRPTTESGRWYCRTCGVVHPGGDT